MSFKEGDRGPFYLVDDNHQIKRKFDRDKGEKKMVTKSKKDIKEELKMKGVRGHCPRDKIEKLANNNGIELTCQMNVVEEGWIGKPKGLLQVHLERGWIDETKIGEYSLKGKASQMDDDGNILLQHWLFI